MTAKLPTPSTSHLSFSTIYEPAEDSFLFLDTLSSAPETSFLKARFASGSNVPKARSGLSSPSPLVLEVGTGSGVILAFLTAQAKHILGRSDVLTIGVDANQDACKATSETVAIAVRDVQSTASEPSELDPPDGSTQPRPSSNTPAAPTSRSALYLGTILSDLTTSLFPASVDILIFNPPYVPTETLPSPTPSPSTSNQTSRFAIESHLLALSYAGGLDGMEVTLRLLSQLPDVLTARGVAYILFCARNKASEALESIMRGERWSGGRGWRWRWEVVGKTGGKGGWERLEIVRIWRGWDEMEEGVGD